MMTKVHVSVADRLKAPFLAQLALQAGVPPGIVQVISGAGETGALLSSHMKIRCAKHTQTNRRNKLTRQQED